MTDGERFAPDLERIRSRVRSLPPVAQAVHALACAQRVVRASLEGSADLEIALNAGWSVVKSGQGDCADIRRDLESRDDVDDDDPVAAVLYAMGAVDRVEQSAWWAASRLLDAAFESVPFPAKATAFRPVAEDAQHEKVRQELQWIDETLTLLERDGATPGVIDRLRL